MLILYCFFYFLCFKHEHTGTGEFFMQLCDERPQTYAYNDKHRTTATPQLQVCSYFLIRVDTEDRKKCTHQIVTVPEEGVTTHLDNGFLMHVHPAFSNAPPEYALSNCK